MAVRAARTNGDERRRAHHTRRRSRPLGGLAAALPLVAVLCGHTGTAAAVVATDADAITVEVVNALTAQPLGQLAVTAKRRVGDQYSWAAQGTTDAAGRVVFRLDGLSAGVPYAFFAKPYNGGTVRSPEATAPGELRFPVGQLPVRVVAGGTEAPLAGLRVTVKEKLADGCLTWISQATTDGGGLVVLDPPGLGSGRVFVLEAPSPWDGTTKRSNEIREAGGLTFVVGNAPLNVTLLDALSDEPLGGRNIAAYERLADGTLQWRQSHTTDAGGRTVFDLDGLGVDRRYMLRVTPFNGGAAESEDLSAAGEFLFRVGTLAVRVVDGGSGAPLPAAKVYALERLGDGSLKKIRSGTTDAAGVIRFDLPGLGRGRVYVLRTASPWDGSTKHSNDLAQAGEVVFAVGSGPLRVALVDGLSGAPLPAVSVSAAERFADGTSRDVAWRTTDAAGVAVFDLDGLGSGRTYVLAANAFGTGRAYSDPLTAAGDYTFRVGLLEVTVVNGADNTPLVAVDVSARERLADGTLKWRAGGKTDARGIIRFDLPGLGKGRTYVLEAKSPWDGTTKRSDDVTQTGRIAFRVGNAPLRVKLVNGLSGDPLPGVKITASRRTDAGTLEWTSQQTTDAAGRAVFDLKGLGDGQVYVLSATPYNGGTVYSDDLREPGPYEFRVGTVELAVVNGADGAPLAGRKVAALAKGADGKWTWTKQGLSDAAGVIRFDLPGLGAGRVYVFEAKSPSDGSTKRSQEITALGRHVFRVGNAPLLVTVQNGLSGEILAGLSVTAAERLTSGELKWAAQRTTDASGRVVFDLDGLGAGRAYVLSCRPYNGGSAYSDDLTQPGPYTFRVGTLEVRVVSGATGQPLVDTRVWAKEVMADGTFKWRGEGRTDAAGVIRFDLPGLGRGRRYVLETKSPIDGSTKRSPEIAEEGRLTFVVGNAPLRVTLVNGLTGAPLPQTKITAREQLPTGETKWVRELVTDAAGVAAFDLDGLGAGRTYQLSAKPYNGGTVYSDPVTQPGDVFFRVGTIPVTVIDGDNDVPLIETKVIAYEKLPDGTRKWVKDGRTDLTGTVHFDLPGVSQTIATAQPPAPRLSDRVYVFRAYDPFGNGKKYYSQFVNREGAVVMRLLRDVEQPLDSTPPTVSILSPADGATVDGAGFTVLGAAADNVRVAQVTVAVVDPVRGTTQVPAAYDAASGQWTAAVTASMITVGQTVTITATAFDQVQNQATASIAVRPIADAAAPQIAFTSHQDGGSVPSSGFLLAGTATDDIGVTSLTATVDDPLLGRTVDTALGVGTDGGWGLAVLRGQVSEGQQVVVTLVAADAAGNQTTAAITLTVTGVDFAAHHLLNRITFGASPDLLAQVEASGVDAFIDQQLTPLAIDDSAFVALLGSFQPTTKADLQRYALLHMLFSQRQLLEVMTQFWDNHFNTDVNKHTVVAYEVAESTRFRQLALGRFRDLLDASAKSPAMLIYLDNAGSPRDDPNENYARELLELHTLGVDGGYTQTDVEQVARAFTGWTVQNGQFVFDPTNHDTGQKIVLGQTLPAGRGIEDGEQVLDLVAAHPSTARFLCTKLGRLLVSDAPPATVVGRCASEFLATGGDIAAVLRLILRSPEFGDPAAFRAKVRTPLEAAVFWVRAFGATSDGGSLVAPIRDMGITLFENPIPTGWSETGDDWINSNLLLQRMRHANRFARASIPGTSVQWRAFFIRYRQSTADAIVGFLLQHLFYSDFTPLDYDVALDALTDGGTRPFFINAPDAEARLQRLVGTVLSFPSAQHQ